MFNFHYLIVVLCFTGASALTFSGIKHPDYDEFWHLCGSPVISTNFTLIGGKYYFVNTTYKVTWFQAAEECWRLDSDLAAFDSLDKFEKLNAIRKQLFPNLKDECRYTFFTATNTIAEIVAKFVTFASGTSETLHHFICEKEPPQGTTSYDVQRSRSLPARNAYFTRVGTKYYFVNTTHKVTWFRALMECRRLGGGLAEFYSSDDIEAVKGRLFDSRLGNYNYSLWYDYPKKYLVITSQDARVTLTYKSQNYFICEKEPPQVITSYNVQRSRGLPAGNANFTLIGRKYYFANTTHKVTRSEATKECERLGGNLAALNINDELEEIRYKFLVDHAKPYNFSFWDSRPMGCVTIGSDILENVPNNCPPENYFICEKELPKVILYPVY